MQLRVRSPLRPAERVERDVVEYPVQPRVQLPHVVAALQGRPRGQERLLHRVLGAGLGQQSLGVAQQRPAVALDYLLERLLVARPSERDEPIVRLGAQHG